MKKKRFTVNDNLEGENQLTVFLESASAWHQVHDVKEMLDLL